MFHLSPSQITCFLEEPSAWVAKYLFGEKLSVGPSAHRGTAVEHGVSLMLRGASLDDAVLSSLKLYNKLCGLVACPKQRAMISPMVPIAYAGLRAFGELVGEQGDVTLDAGLAGPIVGKTDFEFEGCIVDLKTSATVPGKMKPSHKIGAVVYAKATGKKVHYLYVSPSKSAVYTLDEAEIDFCWGLIVGVGKRICVLYEGLVSKEVALQLYAPNPESIYWKGNEAILQRLYGY